MIDQNNPLIQIQAVSKIYQRKNNSIIALDKIDLEINEGEFLALIGQSGSGKTSLLNLIGALDQPTLGKIIFKSKDIGGFSNSELALFRREQIGFIFQTFNLLPALTIVENVESALIHSKLSPAEVKTKAVNALSQLGLEDKLDRFPSELSVGQQQKVAIARALIKNPSIILADEPLGEMDPIAGKEVLDKLIELNNKLKITIIVASHNLTLEKITQRVIFLSAGKIVLKEQTPYKGKYLQ
jgi:putative ABC transport system ATP-binding protein